MEIEAQAEQQDQGSRARGCLLGQRQDCGSHLEVWKHLPLGPPRALTPVERWQGCPFLNTRNLGQMRSSARTLAPIRLLT